MLICRWPLVISQVMSTVCGPLFAGRVRLACQHWSAPATLAQLEENLSALREPELSPERLQQLQAHGERVYEEDATFRKLVRAL